MDSINIIDPSYGNPTDGTGSLVSNQIKLKKESRGKIEGVNRRFKQLTREGVVEHIEKKMENMTPEEAADKKEAMRDNFEDTTDEIVEEVKDTPIEEMNKEFTKRIKEKSEYARTLEARVQALEERDVDEYVATLKPIPWSRRKPLKIKPGNYVTAYKNGKRFSTRVEVPEEEAKFDSDITVDTFEPQIQAEPGSEVDIEPAVEEKANPVEEVSQVSEGFIPETGDMEEVAAIPVAEAVEYNPPAGEEIVASDEEINDVSSEPMTEEEAKAEIDNVMSEIDPAKDIEDDSDKPMTEEEAKAEIDNVMSEINPTKELEEVSKEPMTEEEVKAEIDQIMNQLAASKNDSKDTKLIQDLEEMAKEEPEEAVEEVVVEPEVVEEPVREVPIVVEEREAIIPVKVEEAEKEVVVEEPEEEKDEDLHYDYSDITEKDIENTNSIAILEEMKRAKEKKEKERREAEEKADQEERALVMSREEAEAIRKKAAESERSVQAKMEAFGKYMKAYDEEIEKAKRRGEKAASDKAKADQEIAEYEASIASNASIEKELDSMMEDDDKKKRR